MSKSELTRSVKCLLIATIAITVVVLPIASTFAAGDVVASPLGEGEDQTGDEKGGNDFSKTVLFSGLEAAAHGAPIIYVDCTSELQIAHEADFLRADVERGPPV